MSMPLLNLEIRLELDIVLARQRARQIATLLGFAPLDQTRIATAVSEIARNTVQYAGGGRIDFLVESGSVREFEIRFRTRGAGIKDLEAILEGQYTSPTGLGLGIVGAKRLMDRFTIESTPGAGATVLMAKTLPHRTDKITPEELAHISAELARHAPQGLLDELQKQNQELLNTLQELRHSQSEIAQMHSRELDETNRGVVALYNEFEQGTKALQRLSDLKSRFLSEMSHEFRSPLNSIKGLTGFLLARSDGELSAEQEKQIRLIRDAAEGLSTLVDDLLDLARVEAGKATIRRGSFEVSALFEGLHGMIRPMIDPQRVSLVFEDPPAISTFSTDEGKVAQILRNFLTNAVKFTERGEIRVRAQPGNGDMVSFSVMDTGIGISAENMNRIFEDFGQIDNPLQNSAKGVGLGLPLTRKLAQLLGGTVSVTSEPGAGSTFFAVIPRIYSRESENESGSGEYAILERALIVDDQKRDRYLIKESLAALGQFEVLEAERGDEALSLARSRKPNVIFLDLVLPDMSGFEILNRLKADVETREIPVIINTSKILDETERGRLVEETVTTLVKGNRSPEEAIAQVRDSLSKARLLSRAFERASEP